MKNAATFKIIIEHWRSNKSYTKESYFLDNKSYDVASRTTHQCNNIIHNTSKARQQASGCRTCQLTNIKSKMLKHNTSDAERKCIKMMSENSEAKSLHRSMILLWRSTSTANRCCIRIFCANVECSTSSSISNKSTTEDATRICK